MIEILFRLWIVLLFVGVVIDLFVFNGKKHDEIFGAFCFISLIGIFTILVSLWI